MCPSFTRGNRPPPPPPPPSTTAALDSSLRCSDHILLEPTLVYHYIAPTSWIVFQVPSPLAPILPQDPHSVYTVWSLLIFAPSEEYRIVAFRPWRVWCTPPAWAPLRAFLRHGVVPEHEPEDPLGNETRVGRLTLRQCGEWGWWVLLGRRVAHRCLVHPVVVQIARCSRHHEVLTLPIQPKRPKCGTQWCSRI